MNSSAMRLRHRLLAVGLAAASLAVFALPVRADSAADMFAGLQAKSTGPIQIDAGSLEVYQQDKQRISVFSGGVTVKRGDTLLKAGTIKLYSALEATSPNAFTRIEAGDNISVSSGDQTVTGETAVVDIKTDTITVSGGVVLSQGPNVITGSTLIVNLATGRVRIEQDAGKQIRGVFAPGSANPLQPQGTTQSSSSGQ